MPGQQVTPGTVVRRHRPTSVRSSFTTTDPERLRAYLAADHPGLRARPVGAPRRLVLDVSSIRLGPVDIHRLHLGSEIAFHLPARDPGTWIVQLVRGRCVVTSGHRDVPARVGQWTCGRTDRDHDVRTVDAALRVVRLDGEVAARLAVGMAGIAPGSLRFHGAHPDSARLARYWEETLRRVVRATAGDDRLLDEPLVRTQVAHTVVAAALAVFPNSALDAATGPAAPGTPEPASIRRAVAFVDRHADAPIGLAEIAAAARVGPRALQIAFRRHRGQTPTDYLRQVRLHRAHQELQAAHPGGGETVAHIAARWGFGHTGRFSSIYRRTFGSTPGAVLRR